MYSRRQVHWAEKLSRYDFIIVFQPGKQSGKPDALSRHPDYTSGDDSAARTLTFLKPHHIDTSAIGGQPVFPAYSLNSNLVAASQTIIGTDKALIESIHLNLETDGYLSAYLPLQDPDQPRSPEVA